MNLFSQFLEWRDRLTSDATSTREGPPSSRSANASLPKRSAASAFSDQHLSELLIAAELSFGTFLSDFCTLVATELESHEGREPALAFRSSDRLGCKVSEAIALLSIALEHAKGERRIQGFDFPHRSSELAKALENCSAFVSKLYLDVPDIFVPEYDSFVNLRWGALVSEGVDPERAMRIAHDAMVQVNKARARASRAAT